MSPNLPVLPALVAAGLLSRGGASFSLRRAHGKALVGSYNSSFVSVDGLICVDGPKRIAEGALALKKAGVLGELYNMAVAQANVTCAARGYMVHIGEDPCYPGAQNFVRSLSDVAAFDEAQNAATEYYARSYHLTIEKVALMAACTCHPASEAMASRPASCATINLTSCWAHHDPYNHEIELLGDEGPFQYNTYVLAILKSTAQMPMHRFDQIAPVSCASMGFPTTDGRQDHCFPQNKLHFNLEFADAEFTRSMEVEGGLFTGEFVDIFSKMYGLDTSVLGLTVGCHCFSTSEVGRNQTDCSPTETHTSPIRDWFDGEWSDGQVNISV